MQLQVKERGKQFTLYATPDNDQFARKEAKRLGVTVAQIWNMAMDKLRERANA